MRFPKVGETFQGRYTLVRELGQGGFGTVYLATDGPARREVAVKLVKPGREGYSLETEARFNREVRLIANLRSSHTVRLFDYGRSERGLLFLVFEYLPGRDLSALLADVGPLEPAVVGHILEQVMDALQEAHLAGLLHRDIKPDNIRIHRYLDDPFRATLMDFGIAQPTGTEAQKLTETGTLVGTPRYMSPEQLRFQPLTAASDIYSLGVVAYEMLMGSDAMHGTRLGDQIERLLPGQALALPEGVGGPLRDVVHRMLALEPRDRFADGAAARQALSRRTRPATALLPVAPRETEPPPRTPSTALRRNRAVVAALSAVAVAGSVLAIAIATRRSDDPEPPRTPALPNSLIRVAAPVEVAPPQTDSAVEASRDMARAQGQNVTQRAEDVAPEIAHAYQISHPASAGCGKEPPAIGRTKMEEQGVEVALRIPPHYDRTHPYPVLLLLHDDFETPYRLLGESGFDRDSTPRDMVVVLPRDKKPLRWRKASDLQIVRRALKVAGDAACLDRSRVYAIGYGAGGLAAERLPCVMPEIRGIATMSYRSHGELLCAPNPPIPYIHLTGLRDEHLPPDGGSACRGASTTISLPAMEKLWRTQNQCGDERRVAVKHGKSTCYTWSCEGAPFVSCHLDGGRGWKYSTDRGLWGMGCDGEPPDFPAAETIWDFFQGSGR